MSEETHASVAETSVPLAARPAERETAPTKIAIILSIVWMALCGVFLVLMPSSEAQVSPLVWLMALVAIVMPIALIWVATAAATSSRVFKAESERLQASVDAMRQAYATSQQSGAATVSTGLERKIDDIVQAQRQTETALEALRKVRGGPAEVPSAAKPVVPSPPPGPLTEAQPSLALETPGGTQERPISIEDFVRAAHFPESTEDKEGFRALRLAMNDPSVGPMIRSAQDVLTLMSEDGIYMDDLLPDRTQPEVWRRFAEGERGASVADVGGVRDRSSLALASGRMKRDPVFRDAAHHFLRRFDKTMADFAKVASDQEIAALAETRTARAFMVLARVSGTFD
ncbi:MAG: hypothetical protein AAFY03_02185 [Pseudomonadota bacterium]